MSLTIPDHQLLEILREGEERVVMRGRIGGAPCVTRVILRPVPRALGGLIEGVVTTGSGSLAGLDEEIIATLEGYRVRCRLGADPGLPAVLAAGLADDPDRCPDWAGLPFVTTGWIPGQTLDQANESQRAQALRGVLEILSRLHGNLLAYGDLKPANIIVGVGTHLIDLDTLRAVPGSHQPARVTHRTPRYAAPEQEGDHPLLYLASDIYSFGMVVCELLGGVRPGEVGFPPRLPAPWARIVDACFRSRPLARPTADALLAHLDDGGPLPTWDGSSFRPVTEPVRAAPLPVPPVSHTEAVSPAHTEVVSAPAEMNLAEAVVLEAPAPRRSRLLVGAVVAVGLSGLTVGIGTASWGVARYRSQQEAAAQVSVLMEAMRDHKTIASQNSPAVLTDILSRTEGVLAITETPPLLGLHALGSIWSQRWHYAGARWSEAKFTEGEALVSAALAAGRTETALLAQGVLLGGACRTLPDDDAIRRREMCTGSLAALDEAWSMIRRDESLDWLAVEVQWAGVMTASALARYHEARGDLSSAESVRQDGLSRCQLAWSRLPSAPVNGRELVEDCLTIAGSLRDFRRYLEWSAWLVAADLEQNDTVSSAVRRHIIQSVDVACWGLDFYHSDIPKTPSQRGGVEDLCRYVGMVALGCPEMAEEMRSCARYGWGLSGRRCAAYEQDDGLPWGAALALTRRSVPHACPW